MKLPPNTDPMDAAADWLARRDAGLSPDEQAELQRWLTADARHAAAWHEVESAWQAFDVTREHDLAEGMIRELAARQYRRRWKISAALATGLAAAAAVAFMFYPAHEPAAIVPAGESAPVATSGGVLSRPERRVLEDGSVVELNRGAQIAVHYSPERRDVHLLRGEALFMVAKNPARPFVVTGGRVAVQAVGTAFTVGLGEEAVEVLVTEGKVSVDPATADATAGQSDAAAFATVVVAAGDKLTVPAEVAAGTELHVTPVNAAEMTRALQWRSPRLELTETPLREAVALMNRENRIQISIEDSELAGMRLSGYFNADNAAAFARILENNYHVKVEWRGDDELVLRRK